MRKGLIALIIMTVIAIVLAIFTKVTWVMALEFFLFFVLGQIIESVSGTEEQADYMISIALASVGVVLLMVCFGVSNWWLLLHYGAPAVAGLMLSADKSMATET